MNEIINYLADWFFEKVLIQLNILAHLFDADMTAELERALATSTDVGWRAHR